MPKLSQANLASYNAIQKRSDEAPMKQTVKGFREEDDPYRRFLVTGKSNYQYEALAKAGKNHDVHAGKDRGRWRMIGERPY